MIIFKENGELQVNTIDLPRCSGDINIKMEVEKGESGCVYYLELLCPKKFKWLSQTLTPKLNAPQFYETVLPAKITQETGEIYVQVAQFKDGKLIKKSLISSEPFIVVHESIMASETLSQTDAKNFFEHAVEVVENCQKELTDIKQQSSYMAEQMEVLESKTQNGDFDGVSFVYRGDWEPNCEYYAGDNKQISIVTHTVGGNTVTYIAVKTHTSQAQEQIEDSANWKIFTKLKPIDIESYQLKTSTQLTTADKNIVGAINEVKNKTLDKFVLLYDRSSSKASINLGYPNGVLGGGTLQMDFTPYKRLHIYLSHFSQESKLIMDLTQPCSFDCYSVSMACQTGDPSLSDSLDMANLTVDLNKQVLIIAKIGFISLVDLIYKNRVNTNNYYMYRLIGELYD